VFIILKQSTELPCRDATKARRVPLDWAKRKGGS